MKSIERKYFIRKNRPVSFWGKISRRLRTRFQYQFLRALVIGLTAGSLALLFQYSLWHAELLRTSLMNFVQAHAWWWHIPVALLIMGIGALVAWSTARYSPEAAGSGIPHVKAVLNGRGKLSGGLLIPIKFLGGLLAIGAGFSLGREGPTVQMGAVSGTTVARFLKVSRRARDHLIACGAGAGLAGAFNAPLAGFLFVIEEFNRNLAPMTYGTVLISSLMATLVTQASLGQIPSFHIPQYPTPPLEALPLFVVLGVCAGFLGVSFNRSLLYCSRKGRRWMGPQAWKKGGMVGLVVALALFFIPEITGGGHSVAEILLKGSLPGGHTVWFLIAILVGKLLLTSLCFAAGTPGGIFAPMLLMGATLGALVGHLHSFLFPSLAPTPAAFAVVGMAAMFVSSVRAPLTGMVLILEMTGNYTHLVPLSVACLISYLISVTMRNEPIYDSLMSLDKKEVEKDKDLSAYPWEDPIGHA